MVDKISKLMNDFRITATKYKLDKITDKNCYNEISEIMNELMTEIDNEKNDLDTISENNKIRKNKIKEKMVKLVLILSENDMQNFNNFKNNKNNDNDLNDDNIEKIIKSILDKIKKK